MHPNLIWSYKENPFTYHFQTCFLSPSCLDIRFASSNTCTVGCPVFVMQPTQDTHSLPRALPQKLEIAADSTDFLNHLKPDAFKGLSWTRAE